MWKSSLPISMSLVIVFLSACKPPPLEFPFETSASTTKTSKKVSKPEEQPAMADPRAIYQVPVPKDSPFQGPEDAKVTIIQFSDFQCPACAKTVVSTKNKQGKESYPSLQKVHEEYGDAVKIVFRHNPILGRQAHLAAQASMAAHEQGQFWQYQRLLFQNQRALSRADLEKYAQKLGLNLFQFKLALDTEKFRQKVDADRADAIRFGSLATPGFFINGRFIKGSASFEQFKRIIDRELKKADSLLEKGTPLTDIYAEITKDGLKKSVTNPNPELNTLYLVSISQDDPQKGVKDALVTIVIFSDFECPFCAGIATTQTDERSGKETKALHDAILDKYGESVRIVFKQFPLPKNKFAHLAAQASLAAHEQGKFWEYHDLLFQNRRALTRKDLEKYAQQLELDMSKFQEALDTSTFHARVEKDLALGRSIKVWGAPAFYINGKNFYAAPTLEGFSAAIDTALTEAKALVEQGIAPKDIYRTIIKNGVMEAADTSSP